MRNWAISLRIALSFGTLFQTVGIGLEVPNLLLDFVGGPVDGFRDFAHGHDFPKVTTNSNSKRLLSVPGMRISTCAAAQKKAVWNAKTNADCDERRDQDDRGADDGRGLCAQGVGSRLRSPQCLLLSGFRPGGHRPGFMPGNSVIIGGSFGPGAPPRSGLGPARNSSLGPARRTEPPTVRRGVVQRNAPANTKTPDITTSAAITAKVNDKRL